MSPRRLAVITCALALVLASCAGLFTTGRDFPSPTRDTIQAGKTGKADLVRIFGEPTQVGLDNGDPMWSWIYFKKGDKEDLTKQLTVTFSPDGMVKSYSFNSSFPEDMKALR